MKEKIAILRKRVDRVLDYFVVPAGCQCGQFLSPSRGALMVGTVTPPVGIVLFVTANVAKVSFERVLKATAPFLIPLIVVLWLVSYFPPLTTFIPNLLMGK
jgi:hypothetical protein